MGRKDVTLHTSSDAHSCMIIISAEVTSREELQHLSMPDGDGSPPLPPSMHLLSAQPLSWTEDLIHNKCRVTRSNQVPTLLRNLMLSQMAYEFPPSEGCSSRHSVESAQCIMFPLGYGVQLRRIKNLTSCFILSSFSLSFLKS